MRGNRFRPCAAPASSLVFSVVGCAAVFLSLAPAWSQRPVQKNEGELKTVHGAVVDASDNPIASAVVYLKNLKTLDVATRISDDGGQYRFSGLDPNVDYEVHAEHGELTSPTHKISSLVSRKDIVLDLKVSKKKAATKP